MSSTTSLLAVSVTGRLHVLDLIVLEGFLNLHRLEEPCLLQIGHQVGYRIRTQRGCLPDSRLGPYVHAPQHTASVPFTVSPSMASRFTGLPVQRAVNRSRPPPLVVVGLGLPFHIARFHVAEFAVFLLGTLHLHRDRLSLAVQPVPVAKFTSPASSSTTSTSAWAIPCRHFHRGHRRRVTAAALILLFRGFQQIDFDHRDQSSQSQPPPPPVWPGFCSTSRPRGRPPVALRAWNGFNNSTGMENPAQRFHQAGTFAEPPAR